MVVDPHDQDRGEAEDEREVGRPLMQDGGDEVAGRDLLELRNTQIKRQNRDCDRDDPVAERLETGRFVPPGCGSGDFIALDETGA
jgi:hypothetical protein